MREVTLRLALLGLLLLSILFFPVMWAFRFDASDSLAEGYPVI